MALARAFGANDHEANDAVVGGRFGATYGVVVRNSLIGLVSLLAGIWIIRLL